MTSGEADKTTSTMTTYLVENSMQNTNFNSFEAELSVIQDKMKVIYGR